MTHQNHKRLLAVASLLALTSPMVTMAGTFAKADQTQQKSAMNQAQQKLAIDQTQQKVGQSQSQMRDQLPADVNRPADDANPVDANPADVNRPEGAPDVNQPIEDVSGDPARDEVDDSSAAPDDANAVNAENNVTADMQHNLEFSTRYFQELWGQGNIAVADELFAQGLVVDSNSVELFSQPTSQPASQPTTGAVEAPRGMQTVEELKMALETLRKAIPDLTFTVEEQLTVEQNVITRWVANGTQQGELLGLPATNKEITFQGIDIHTYLDGKMMEVRSIVDMKDLIAQLRESQGNTVPAPADPTNVETPAAPVLPEADVPATTPAAGAEPVTGGGGTRETNDVAAG